MKFPCIYLCQVYSWGSCPGGVWQGEEQGPEDRRILNWPWSTTLQGLLSVVPCHCRPQIAAKFPVPWPAPRKKGDYYKNDNKNRYPFPRLTFFSFYCNGFIPKWATSCLCSQRNFYLTLCLWWMNWNSSLQSLKNYYSSVWEPGLRGCMRQWAAIVLWSVPRPSM